MTKIKNTEYLNHKILESKNVKSFLEENKLNIVTTEFNHLLYTFIEEKGLKNSDFFRVSGLTDSYGYQLLNGKRQPSRDKVLQASIGLNLSIGQTNTLLKSAEKSELYIRTKKDAIVMFALNNGLSFIEVNELLYDEGCAVLD